MNIRQAKTDDAESILQIYAPYIINTAVTFEYDVPSIDVFEKRIEATLKHYPYIVAEDDGTVVGYAYAGLFKERAAYSRCVETSIYVKTGEHGKGIGKALYAELEEQLKKRGILNLNACISWSDSPNKYLSHQSQQFHAGLGYTECARFHNCGYKFGRWFDIIWMEKMIGVHINSE